MRGGSRSGPQALHQPDVCRVTSLWLSTVPLAPADQAFAWAALDYCLCHQPLCVSSDPPCVHSSELGAPGPLCSAKNQWNCTQGVLIGVGADGKRLMVELGSKWPCLDTLPLRKILFWGCRGVVAWCGYLAGGGRRWFVSVLGFFPPCGIFLLLFFFLPLNAVSQSSTQLVSLRRIFVFVNICGWIRHLAPDLKSYSLPTNAPSAHEGPRTK